MKNLYILRPKIEGNYLCNDKMMVIAKAVINGVREDWREITEKQKKEIEDEWAL